MKPIKKCMAFLLIASMTALCMATVVSASEDIPGTYYADQAEQPAPQAQQEEVVVHPKSIQEYQEDNDAIGIPKSRVEQSPSLNYDGAFLGDAENAEAVDLEDVTNFGDDDATLANASNDNRIANSTDNTRSTTENAETTALENNTETEPEEGKENAVTTGENPDTGRADSYIPISIAGLLFAGYAVYASRKLGTK